MKGHQSAEREQLDLRDRQIRAYNLVPGKDRLIKAKHQAVNEDTEAIMNNRSKFNVGDWTWMYDDHSTITGEGKHVRKPTEDSTEQQYFTLISKQANSWTSPYRVLFLEPV